MFFIADSVFGMFGKAAREMKLLDTDPLYKLGVVGTALYEGKQVLSCSKLVQIGRNCVIDPSAVIHGPTVIGDNVTIGAGVVIDNCIIGDHVNISQGNQLLLSVVGGRYIFAFPRFDFYDDIDGTQHGRAIDLSANVCGWPQLLRWGGQYIHGF